MLTSPQYLVNIFDEIVWAIFFLSKLPPLKFTFTRGFCDHCGVLMVILFFHIRTLVVVTMIQKGFSSSSEPEEGQKGLPSVRPGHVPRGQPREHYRRLVGDIRISSPYKDVLHGCGFRLMGWAELVLGTHISLAPSPVSLPCLLWKGNPVSCSRPPTPSGLRNEAFSLDHRLGMTRTWARSQQVSDLKQMALVPTKTGV